MFQIEIPRRSQFCAERQEKFEPGMDFYSALWDGENESSYLRKDFCPACWECFLQGQSFDTMRSYWKSKIPLKKEESPLPKQRDERALYLLKEALSKGGADDQAEAFILALFLARRRLVLLRQEFTRDNGLVKMVYEVPTTEEMLCVQKFALSDLQIEKIQLELAKKFK